MTTFLLGLLVGLLLGAIGMFMIITWCLTDIAASKTFREYVGNWLLEAEQAAVKDYIAARKRKRNQEDSEEEHFIS